MVDVVICISRVSYQKGPTRVSCQKDPTRHAYAWQIGPFWQDTLDISLNQLLGNQRASVMPQLQVIYTTRVDSWDLSPWSV